MIGTKIAGLPSSGERGTLHPTQPYDENRKASVACDGSRRDRREVRGELGPTIEVPVLVQHVWVVHRESNEGGLRHTQRQRH